MTGPTVVFEIGGVDYGACVQQMDIWQESLNGIGRWEVIADPAGPCAWPAMYAIAPDSQVRLRIAGITYLRGYVDDVLPLLDEKGYHTKLYGITGRNRGMDLAQHQVSGEWQNTAADVIIGNAAGSIFALTAAPGTELTRVTLGAGPANIDYEADRTYLADAVRDIANLVDFDYYVDNTAWPANANFNFFAVGTQASGRTLIDFAGSVTNNILDIKPYGEAVGFNIKNDIEAHVGSLEDHYTDLNAQPVIPPPWGWIGINCLVTNESTAGFIPATTSPYYLNGKSSIRADQNTGGLAQPIIDLDFAVAGVQSEYSYTSLDLSEPCIGSFNYLIQDSVNAIKRLRIRLRDTGANEIEFYRSAFAGFAKCRNCTDQPQNLEWRKVDFQLGCEAGIEPALIASTQGIWYQFAGAGFDWTAVDRIRLTTTGVNLDDGDYFIVDGLTFPNLEVHSIQQDGPGAGTSITLYGRRMKDFYRPDIKNQVELNDYAAKMLEQLKNPKETLHVVTIGETSAPAVTLYGGQTVEVVAPAFGIGGPLITDTETWRIIRLHHKVVKMSDDSDKPGYTFTTEYDLVRHQYYGTATTQLTDMTKFINITDPDGSFKRNTRLEERYRRRDGNVRLIP